MTKAELTAHIIEHCTDPWTDCCEEYKYSEPLDLDTAADVLAQIREDEEGFEPDEKLSDDVTPTMFMEAYNCHVRYMKHELRVKQLAEFLTDEECVCEYANWSMEYLDDPLQVYPTDWLIDDKFPFKMIDDSYAHPLFLIELGQRSPKFNANDDYCWYDRQKNQLFSSDTPFADGVIDAEAFARFIIDNKDVFYIILNGILDDDDCNKYFGCTFDELCSELNVKGE